MLLYPLFLFDLIGMIDSRGLMSVVSALNDAALGKRAIDADVDGLRSLFVIAVSLPLIVLSWSLAVNIGKRWAALLLVAGGLVGGVVLNDAYGAAMVDHLMAERGYARCNVRDHEEGKGRGLVLFGNYVRDHEDCGSSV